jgi:hypothetical protein
MNLRSVAALAIAAADASVQQSPGNAQIIASPGAAAQEAAQSQQPCGGESGALIFHH